MTASTVPSHYSARGAPRRFAVVVVVVGGCYAAAPACDGAPRRRKAAIAVGTLFIVGDIAGVLSLVVTRGLLDGPDVLAKIAANQGRLALGALLILVMGFALAMIPVVMYPIFKKCNEVLALGYVVYRGALETVGYMATAGTLLLLVELSREHAEAASPAAPHARLSARSSWRRRAPPSSASPPSPSASAP